MRKRLSAENKVWGYFYLVLAIFFAVAYYTEADTTDDGIVYNNMYLVLFFGIGVFSYINIIAKIIEFDNVNLYKISGNKEEVIPFLNIKKVKSSNLKINNTYLHKVWYINELGEEVIFRFSPKLFNKNLNEFEKAVLKVNPKCEFKSSFF